MCDWVPGLYIHTFHECIALNRKGSTEVRINQNSWMGKFFWAKQIFLRNGSPTLVKPIKSNINYSRRYVWRKLGLKLRGTEGKGIKRITQITKISEQYQKQEVCKILCGSTEPQGRKEAIKEYETLVELHE